MSAPSTPRAVEVHTTVPSAEVADELVDGLLGLGLVACGKHVGPVTSRYRWNGGLETAR